MGVCLSEPAGDGTSLSGTDVKSSFSRKKQQAKPSFSRDRQPAKPSSTRTATLPVQGQGEWWECRDLGTPQGTENLTWLSPCPGGAEILTWCCRGKGSGAGLDQQSFTWPLSASSRCSFTGASGFTAHKLSTS